MNGKKPVVIVTRKLPDSVETRMRELFDTRLNLADKPMSQSELADAVKTADVLVPTVTDRIDAELIAEAGEQLKLIASFGNGVDNIDVQTASERGITVTNTPGVLTDDTADVVFPQNGGIEDMRVAIHFIFEPQIFEQHLVPVIRFRGLA